MADHLSVNDEQLDLKKRARRRLIGAVVFATTAAVVLPMVMDAEPPPALPNIELKIPAQSKGFVPPTGKNPVAVAPAPVVPPAVEPVAPVAATVSAPTPTASTVVAEPPKPHDDAPAAKVAEPKAKVEPKAEPKAKAGTKAAPEQKPAVAASTADAKRAQAILEGQPARPAAEGPHVVLIGAFANAGNVDTLKKKIGEMGIKVYTEPLETPQGKKTRVRAGPFPNRDAAEKAAARMKSIGVKGVVAAKT